MLPYGCWAVTEEDFDLSLEATVAARDLVARTGSSFFGEKGSFFPEGNERYFLVGRYPDVVLGYAKTTLNHELEDHAELLRGEYGARKGSLLEEALRRDEQYRSPTGFLHVHLLEVFRKGEGLGRLLMERLQLEARVLDTIAITARVRSFYEHFGFYEVCETQPEEWLMAWSPTEEKHL